MDGEKILGVSNDVVSGSKKVTQPIGKQPFDADPGDGFSKSLGGQGGPSKAVPVEAAQPIDTRPNPLDLARDMSTKKVDPANTLDQIERNISKATDRITEVKQTLESPNVGLKQSYQALLENKLIHIDESLKVALDKVGIEYTPPVVEESGVTGAQDAIKKFLSFLNNGQNELQNVASEVRDIRDKSKGGSIDIGDLLSVQLKVSFVQQELELFANLLNKALESTKTVMNVQI